MGYAFALQMRPHPPRCQAEARAAGNGICLILCRTVMRELIKF